MTTTTNHRELIHVPGYIIPLRQIPSGGDLNENFSNLLWRLQLWPGCPQLSLWATQYSKVLLSTASCLACAVHFHFLTKIPTKKMVKIRHNKMFYAFKYIDCLLIS